MSDCQLFGVICFSVVFSLPVDFLVPTPSKDCGQVQFQELERHYFFLTSSPFLRFPTIEKRMEQNENYIFFIFALLALGGQSKRFNIIVHRTGTRGSCDIHYITISM